MFLAFTSAKGFFSDNYFDLLPGETIKVVFRPDDDSFKVENDTLKILTIRDTYE